MNSIRNLFFKFGKRYHYSEIGLILFIILIVGLAIYLLKLLCPRKWEDVIFSVPVFFSFIVAFILLGLYLFKPVFCRKLCALICKQKVDNTFGAILDSKEEEEKEYFWEQKKDLTIPENTQALHISNVQKGESSKIKEAFMAFENGKYQLVISMESEVLATIKTPKKEAHYRLLLELAYNELEDYAIEARISNLSLLCNSFKNFIPANILVSLQCNFALLYVRQNQLEKAKVILNDIFKGINSKKSSPPHEIYAKINDLRSTILLKEQHPLLALSYLERAWNYSNDSAWYGFKIARIYADKLHNPYKAIEYAKSAFSLLRPEDDPNLYDALVQMIFYLEAFVENYQSSYEFIDQYTTKSPYILACKAYILVQLKKYDEAATIAKQVLEQDPSQSTAINAKGIVHLKKREFTIAERCFTTALSDFEKEQGFYVNYYTAEIYYHRGICNIKLNNLGQALLDISQAEKLGYNHFEADYLDIIYTYMLKENENKN